MAAHKNYRTLLPSQGSPLTDGSQLSAKSHNLDKKRLLKKQNTKLLWSSEIFSGIRDTHSAFSKSPHKCQRILAKCFHYHRQVHTEEVVSRYKAAEAHLNNKKGGYKLAMKVKSISTPLISHNLFVANTTFAFPTCYCQGI